VTADHYDRELWERYSKPCMWEYKFTITCIERAYTVRPMKIDIMFLVPARMGFICRTKIFHYSLFLKNRLNKTPNWSPDQSLIAAFRKRNSNCIFLKILLARMLLFFMSALVCVEIYCSVGRIKLKWIIHRFTSDFYGRFYWVKEIIDKQNSNTKNNEKWKKSAPNFWKLWTRNMISIFIGLTVDQ
jgi:hypothetical protein